MPHCVCGCPLHDHCDDLISVPLPPRPDGPIYPTNGAMNNLAATYDRSVCVCGCCEYLPDPLEEAS